MVDDKVDKVPSTSTLVDPTSSNWARPVLTNARLAVEVFDGTNHFGLWKSEVLDALFQQGLDIVVEESKPEDVEERNWLTINQSACGTIRSCLSREQRYAFSKETFAEKLWVALEEKFLKKNCHNKLFMKKRLFRFTYVPGTTMNDRITSFNQLVTDLMNMDKVFKDQDLALILLGSLPEKYELLETTLLNGKDDVFLSEVYAALYSKNSKGRTSRFVQVETSRQRLRKDKCDFCHEKGHWKRDCPRLKTKDNHYKEKAVAEANVTKCDDEESHLSLATSSSRNASEIWLLDSACSHHITPHREWFSNFEEHEEVNEDGTIVTLKGVRYSPKLKKNLISVGTLESKGFEVRAKDEVMKIIYGVLVVMKGIRKINNTYHYKGRKVVGTIAAVTDGDRNSEAVKLWHMRLGHAGEKSLNLLIKQGLLKGLSSFKLDLCDHCINGKTTRVKFGTTIHKTQGILDYVHSDVWGPLKTIYLGGRHYYVTFVNDFSRRVWVYTLKTKDEVLGVFIKWKKMMENQTCRKIKHLRTDNGGEYKNNLFTKFCEDEGIVRHFIVIHTPQQNEAVTYACHLVNRLPSTAIDGKTQFEKWYGKSASDYDSLHVFGSAAYYHVKESKLDPRAKKALFMRITSRIKGYRLWCPDIKKTIFSRDVTFNESTMLKKVNVEQLDGTPKKVEFERIIVPADREADDNSPMVKGDYEEEEVQAEEPRQQQHESIATSKPKRNTKRPARLNDTVACASSIAADDVLTTYSEAIRDSENEKWRIAMSEEMQSLQKNQTWELTNLPEGKKAIGCKWVYAKKEGFPGQDDVRYKARLVAKGYAQKEGIDYNEVFYPVVKHSSIRILLALLAQLDLELVQMDMKTAFLHGDLEEEIYMQSPRQWYKRFDKFMMESKYTKSKYDHFVYLKKLQDGSFVYLLLYVDDMLIASQSLDEIEKLKTRLKIKFEMKDLGEAKMIFGMEIDIDRKLRKLCLTQKQYLRRVLKRFRFDKQTKRVSTLLASQFKISAAMSPKNDTERAYMEKVPYANAVGSLMYAMICTRPYISHVVGMVSRYMHNPGKGHWQTVKWILRYIHNTVNVGLVFEHGSSQWVEGYCDSNYAGDLDKRRSTTGYVFTMAKAPAVKEAIWLQGLLDELGINQKIVTMYSDSQSAIHLAKNQVYHARTKHIDVRYHFIREILEEGRVRIQKVHTSKNPADMLTKVLAGIKFNYCLDLINDG
ncbi:transposable element [Tanacetum coccineum]|uniref:Transposable element n=1 Tax=Tanacetum coccineum TaxID=301880 RepID=A0ABQ5BT03_9ASTR